MIAVTATIAAENVAPLVKLVQMIALVLLVPSLALLIVATAIAVIQSATNPQPSRAFNATSQVSTYYTITRVQM